MNMHWGARSFAKDRKRSMIAYSSLVLPVVGGLGVSLVNKYTKRAFYDIWTNIIEKKQDPKLAFKEGERLSQLIEYAIQEADGKETEVEKLLNFHKRYQRWRIDYKEDMHPLTAYICTQRGFFNLSLCSGQVLKACPSEKPKLLSKIQDIYNRLNADKTSEANQDQLNMLEKVHYLCLINMILKDFSLLVSVLHGYEEPPLFFIHILKKLNELTENEKSKTKDLKTIITETINSAEINTDDAMRNCRKYFESFKNKMKPKAFKGLFYRDYPFTTNAGNTSSISSSSATQNGISDHEKQVQIIGKMGMDFTFTCNKYITLFLTDVDEENGLGIEDQSILSTGEWVNIFQMHYSITINSQ